MVRGKESSDSSTDVFVRFACVLRACLAVDCFKMHVAVVVGVGVVLSVCLAHLVRCWPQCSL